VIVFFLGYFKDKSFVPPLPVRVNDLSQHIIKTVASADEDMLGCVWNELDYRIDICGVTKGSHTEQTLRNILKTHVNILAVSVILWFL
jgi:hypothetical protein